MFRKILVPLDGSALSERSIPWARALSTRRPVLLRAVEPIYFFDMSAPFYFPQLESQAKRYLREVVAEQAPGAHTLVRTGSPVAVVLETARRIGADLIVAARHDGSELSRRLLGGTTDRLIHRVPIPLLLVPARGTSFPPLAIHTMVAEESDAVMPWVRKLARRHGSRIVGASKELLVEAARKHQADLVITSAPRRNALQRLLFGDVTSPIVDRSPAPVLFVPSAAPVSASLVAAGKGARS
jgi:nucleotide-binding universal stress UspA family protein